MESRIDELLDKAYTELLESLRKYRDLLEELTSGYSTLGVIKTVVKDFTGCESHEDFTDTVLQAVKVLLGREVTNPARALVELFNEYHNAAMTLNNQHPVIVVLDPNVEEGYLGVLGLSAGDKIRYAIPFVIIKYVSGQGELRQYLGIEALKWLVEYKREGRISVALRALNIEPQKVEEYAYRIASRLQSDLHHWLKSRLHRLGGLLREACRESCESIETVELKPELLAGPIPIIGVRVESEPIELPEDVKKWMEEASINHVARMFKEQGCRVLEVNIGVQKPYDLLLECPNRGLVYVEVKSHLKHVYVAELTPGETKLAEANPDRYIVCNVMGLENPDENTWITICDLYKNIPKKLETRIVEEVKAKLFFTETSKT
jgi:hypothetical protein